MSPRPISPGRRINHTKIAIIYSVDLARLCDPGLGAGLCGLQPRGQCGALVVATRDGRKEAKKQPSSWEGPGRLYVPLPAMRPLSSARADAR